MRKHAKHLAVAFLLLTTLAFWTKAAFDLTRSADAQVGGGNLGRGPSVGGVVVLQGSGDPTSGGGAACTRPCLYLRTGTDNLYLKTGSGATAWSLVAIGGGSPSFTDVTVTGTLGQSTTGIIALRAGTSSDLPLRFAADTDNGIYYSGVANRWELAANGADQLSIRNSLVHTYQAATATQLDVTNNITSTSGNIVATAGDVTAGDDLIATDDIAVVDIVATGRTTSAGFTSSVAGDATTPAYNWSADTNNGPYYSGVADRVDWAAGGADTFSFRGSALTLAYGTLQTVAFLSTSNAEFRSYIDIKESSAPGAPAADYARVYAVVDGGSKTDLSAHFQSGTAQVFTQEP